MTTYDAIVVGGGLAGMLTALETARALAADSTARVLLVSHAAIGDATASAWAQGGIAAAVGIDDSPALHAADTVAAGAGIVERRVAARLAVDAPRAIARVAELGVRFDRDASQRFALGREAAHSRRRILRAGGDATGAELVRAVALAVRAHPAIVLLEGARVRRLRLDGDGVCGVVLDAVYLGSAMASAPSVVLATGGIGGLYRYTTNPTASRGSGIALAARAGARLADLEFVQFHPTALDVPSDPLPLMTEALRGEGARLIDEMGARLMAGVDPALELAPRDVVARAVFAVSQRGGHAFVDARDAIGAAFPTRFPTVFAAAQRCGIDPRTAPIPVVAAAHYHMGGVAVDLDGRTSVPGLFACGEVAATGVHGANRLASNSLLEAVVYPERIARAIAAARRFLAIVGSARDALDAPGPRASLETSPRRDDAHELAQLEMVRDIMYRDVGVERDERGLARAAATLGAIGSAASTGELADAALVGEAIARAALRRRESRGSHFRRDFAGAVGALGHRSYVTLADLATARSA